MSKPRLVALLVMGTAALVGVAAWFASLRDHPARYFFFPPGDLYGTLAEARIDVAQVGSVAEFSLEHKYPGTHSLGIAVARPPPITGWAARPAFRIRVQVYDQQRLLDDRVVGDEVYPFSDKTPDLAGLELFLYEVPRELPLRRSLRWRLEVVQPDVAFQESYGDSVAFVSKRGDV